MMAGETSADFSGGGWRVPKWVYHRSPVIPVTTCFGEHGGALRLRRFFSLFSFSPLLSSARVSEAQNGRATRATQAGKRRASVLLSSGTAAWTLPLA